MKGTLRWESSDLEVIGDEYFTCPSSPPAAFRLTDLATDLVMDEGQKAAAVERRREEMMNFDIINYWYIRKLKVIMSYPGEWIDWSVAKKVAILQRDRTMTWTLSWCGWTKRWRSYAYVLNYLFFTTFWTGISVRSDIAHFFGHLYVKSRLYLLDAAEIANTGTDCFLWRSD